MSKTDTRSRPTAADLLGEPTTIGLGRACEYLGVSRSVGYQLAATGDFPVRVERIGNSYRIPTSSLMRYLEITPEPAADSKAGVVIAAEPQAS